MQAVSIVFKLAIQEIVRKFHDMVVFIGKFNEYTVKLVLQQHNCNIDENTITLVTDSLRSLNPLSSISGSGCLGSDQKRLSYFKEKFGVIDPVEHVLVLSSKKMFVLVPVLRTLQRLLNRGDVIDKVLAELNKETQPGRYNSSSDGLYLKENPLLSGEDLSISLTLYIDDFEICNPLGTSRKKHNLCAV